ncbi:hypothetical protein PoB_004992000 [Plakobranchus ocellatus]|uniref:Uncharacterized protein n=1 Tax=Plakobranchus ocellatus TaxID=259542 RepID=A0AAV4BWE3_9GAST|nr:hypothetical protein PoB_004992000 [Plakobranchus ocellatus]
MLIEGEFGNDFRAENLKERIWLGQSLETQELYGCLRHSQQKEGHLNFVNVARPHLSDLRLSKAPVSEL